jgi:PmbA protein
MKDLFYKVMENSDAAELFKKEEEVTSIGILQGTVQNINGKKGFDVSLRLVKDGNMGSAVATSLEDETIIERALLSCRYQKQEPVDFSDNTPADVKCYDEKVVNISVEEMVAEGERILELFKKHDNNIGPDIHISKSVKNIHILNSKGFDHNYSSTNYSVSMTTKTIKGFMEVGFEIDGANFNVISEEEIISLIQRHGISQNRVTVETNRMPVIFSGKAMGSLMMRLMAGVKAGNVIKKMSPLGGKLNEQVFSDAITIRDNGILDFGLGTCAFDDEGIKSTDTMLIEKGILKNYLAGVSDAKKMDITPTGNSFKRTMFSQDIEDSPAVDCTNLIIEGNSLSDEELIKSVKRGIFIDSVMGAHTGNIIAGEYSLNIGCGYLIEDGKFTGKVMDAMVAGNIYEDFKKISAVGTKAEAMRTIFYTIGYSPNVLFDELSIVGK